MGHETIDDNGTAAHVRFMGEIRVTGAGIAGKKTLDFTVTLAKWLGKWCVDKESSKGLVDDLLKLR